MVFNILGNITYPYRMDNNYVSLGHQDHNDRGHRHTHHRLEQTPRDLALAFAFRKPTVTFASTRSIHGTPVSTRSMVAFASSMPTVVFASIKPVVVIASTRVRMLSFRADRFSPLVRSRMLICHMPSGFIRPVPGPSFQAHLSHFVGRTETDSHAVSVKAEWCSECKQKWMCNSCD